MRSGVVGVSSDLEFVWLGNLSRKENENNDNDLLKCILAVLILLCPN